MGITTERFFLFTDIEGSTRLWEQYPVAMRSALARHDALLREEAERWNGEVFKTIGDAFCIAFVEPESCQGAALSIQRALFSESWGEVGALKVRIALHGGEVEARDNDYFGAPLNKIARLRDAGHGGQTLLTASLKERLEKREKTEAAEVDAKYIDCGLHHLRGIEEAEQIFQLGAEGLPETFPTLRTETAHPHNLPPETTTFVGRRTDLLGLRSLLTEKNARLVTLTGLGGSGKSRLAIRAASDALWHYSGGIRYVDAVSLSRADEFPSALSHVCGLEEDAKKTALQQLCERFRTVRALVVVDGPERFEEIADDIAVLLKGTEQLQVLVASRSLLYLSMEHEYALEPMSTAECLLLFIERAQQAQREFSVTPENRETLEAICQKLEGVPLAIELAAAQVRTLTPEQIRDALSQRFEVLSTRMRDLHPRHRSLRSTIDWSYQTLSPEELRLFRSLSCFVGSFTIEAVEQIRGGQLCQVHDIQGTLTALREKSLLRVEFAATDRFQMTEAARYLLQDSLREFGSEALQNEAPTQVQALSEKHGSYFHSVVLAQEPQLKGAQQKAALKRLESDAPNIRTALERSLSAGNPTRAAQLAIGLGRFWEMRGWLREGRHWLQRLIPLEPTIPDVRTRAELLMTAGRLEWNGADPDRAIRSLESCVALCQEQQGSESEGSALPQSMALTLLGMIAYSRGELERSDRYYEAALPLKTQLGDLPGEVTIKTNLGINAMARGDNERALELFEECLAFRQKMGDTLREAHAWNCIGATALELGQSERATTAFQKSQTMYEALGDPVHAAHARINLGEIAVRQELYEQARNHYSLALATLRPLEEWRGIVASQLGEATVALAQLRLSDVRSSLREALQISRQNGYLESIATVLELMSQLADAEGESERATLYSANADQLRLTPLSETILEEALLALQEGQ